MDSRVHAADHPQGDVDTAMDRTSATMRRALDALAEQGVQREGRDRQGVTVVWALDS
jgi:hypothetical protein